MRALVVLVVVCSVLLTAEARDDLVESASRVLNLVESQAEKMGQLAQAKAHLHAGHGIEDQENGFALQDPDLEQQMTHMGDLQKEVARLQHDIESMSPKVPAEHHAARAHAQHVDAPPRFAEIRSEARAETEVDMSAEEKAPSEADSSKAVLRDLMKEMKQAKGEEKRLLAAQIRALQGGSTDAATPAAPARKNKAPKKRSKKRVGSSDSLKKLVSGLRRLQNGASNYAETHALLLSTLQEVRLAWQQKQAEEIQRIDAKEQQLEQKKQALMVDACESNSCPNDSPPPYVAPVTGCEQHAQHFCTTSHRQCSQNCWSDPNSNVRWVTPQACHSACDTANTQCVQVQVNACGSS